MVIDHTGKEVTDRYPVEMLDKNLQPSRIESLLENSALVDKILPKMISSATEMANALGEKEKTKGLQRMKRILNHEINRLTSLQKKNKDIRPEEIQAAIAEREKLSNLINKASVRLDALQLIHIA